MYIIVEKPESKVQIRVPNYDPHILIIFNIKKVLLAARTEKMTAMKCYDH